MAKVYGIARVKRRQESTWKRLSHRFRSVYEIAVDDSCQQWPATVCWWHGYRL